MFQANRSLHCFTTIIAALIGGCTTTQTPLDAVRSSKFEPDFNKIVNAHLGDTIFSGQIADTIPSLELGESYTSKAFLVRDTHFPKQTLVATYKLDHFTVYKAKEIIPSGRTSKILGSAPTGKGFCLKEEPLVIALLLEGPECVSLASPWPKFTLSAEPKENAFVRNQEVIFGGIKNKEIVFLYLESEPNSARPSFSQEILLPYEEDEIFWYRGIKLKVLDVTSKTIRYTLEDFS